MNQQLIDDLKARAKAARKRVVFPESSCVDVLRCVQSLLEQDIADILLVGNPDKVSTLAQENDIDLDGAVFFDHTSEAERASLVKPVMAVSPQFKEHAIVRRADKPLNAALFLVLIGDADCCAVGREYNTPEIIVAGQTILGSAPDVSSISSVSIVDAPGFEGSEGPMFAIGDCILSVFPDAAKLADTAIATADTVYALLGWEPRVAMLSYSTDGDIDEPSVDAIHEAIRIAHERRPSLKIDGDFQLDTAIDEKSASRKLSRESDVAGKANVLVFPNAHATNIGVKLIKIFGHADIYGPIVRGFSRPICIFPRSAPASGMMGNVLTLLARTS